MQDSIFNFFKLINLYSDYGFIKNIKVVEMSMTISYKNEYESNNEENNNSHDDYKW